MHRSLLDGSIKHPCAYSYTGSHRIISSNLTPFHPIWSPKQCIPSHQAPSTLPIHCSKMPSALYVAISSNQILQLQSTSPPQLSKPTKTIIPTAIPSHIPRIHPPPPPSPPTTTHLTPSPPPPRILPRPKPSQPPLTSHPSQWR